MEIEKLRLANQGREQRIEKLRLQNKRIELENDRQNHINTQIKEANDLRGRMAWNIFAVVLFWMVSVLILLLLQRCASPPDRLSDNVLIALLSTATANVVGLLITVTGYLFPKSQSVPPHQAKD